MSIDAIPSTTTTTKTVNNNPRLPPELWLIIFRFATSSPITYPPSDAESTNHYEPFQSHIIALSDAAVSNRCAITLVCRQWRALAGDMRYEDIRIGHGIAALHAALSEPAADVDTNTDNNTIVNGIAANTDTTSPPPRPSRHRVRRAVLPYAYTATPTYHQPPALALLALLPHLEVLVRPPLYPLPSPLSSPSSHRRTLIPITTTTIYSLPSPLRFEFPTAAPALSALRRLEWAFYKTGAAARAGGINSLTDMLKAAPSLSELVLTGPMPHGALRQDRIPLRALRTIRFRSGACGCPFLNLQTSYWVMPALENVVVEGGGRAKAFEELWGTFGAQVRVVQLELGGDGDGMRMDDVREIVNACPELEELNLRIGCGHLNGWSPMDNTVVDAVSASAPAYVHDALQRLGICVDSDSPEWSVKTWMALAEFVGEWKLCPALRQVVLYMRDVEVKVAKQNPQFYLLHEELTSSGRQLVLRSVHT